MSTRVLICDDSRLARKQMAASLPDDWDIELSFAENGQQALELIAQGKAELLFLDLNMPVMDGYQTLSHLFQNNIDCMVVVASGDVQPEARMRVKKLGAIDFIRKPVNGPRLASLLRDYGLYQPGSQPGAVSNALKQTLAQEKIDYLEGLSEVTNVAMGQAGELLARLLNVFVKLPVPNVNLMDIGELRMALSAAGQGEEYTAVCQGFIGGGISGEALLLFNDSCHNDMARLLEYQGSVNATARRELVMDVASILSSACITGIARQLDLTFSQSHPYLLTQKSNDNHLIGDGSAHWKRTLAVEILYEIEGHDIQCDLLLLFTESCLKNLYQKIDRLVN